MTARLRAALVATVLAACAVASAAGVAQDAPARLLVSLSGESKVAVFDVATARRVATIDVPSEPHEIAVARDGRTAYVADPGTPAAVSAIDIAGGTARAHHRVEPRRMPHDLRVSRDGATLWVVCAPDREIAEFDARTGGFRRAWAIGADGGWFVAITPDERRFYVPHLEGKRVTSIDLEDGKVTTVVEGGAQSGIDVSPDGREVWVVSHEQKKISIIDGRSARLVGAIDLPSDAFGRLRFTPDGTRVVLVQDRQLTMFDARSRRAIGSLEMPLAGKVPAVSPDGGRLAVSNPDDDRVTIVTLSPLRVEMTFEVGKTPDGVAWVR